MALYDATGAANRGTGGYNPSSPFFVRVNQIDFSVYTFTATGGANQVNVIPLNQGEWLQTVAMRVDSPGNASTTVSLTDTRTGAASSGAVLAATSSASAAGTTVLAAGGALGLVSGVGTTSAGYLQLTNVAAFALNTGKATVAAFIGGSF
jgi:hypothetical protein